MRKTVILLLLTATLGGKVWAQNTKTSAVKEKLENYFKNYKPQGAQFSRTAHLSDLDIDDEEKTLTVKVNDAFAEQSFTPQVVENIYSQIKEVLPSPYADYYLRVETHDYEIQELIPNRLKKRKDKERMWGDIDYKGEPWVKNMSQPHDITEGLQGRHLSLWASHGRYYDVKAGQWKWQRPNLFNTTEDLFTQTIVVPYLIPMLENAGAIVFTPRERVWQSEEIIVDNDGSKRNYIEATSHGKWKTTDTPGFAYHDSAYVDGENPFEAGTARMVKTTNSKSRYSLASYQPDFPKEGRYAVYVSYQTLDNSIDNAEYTVWHKGERTVFHVNQQMGGGTWVYLGTFEFDKGYSEFNRVTLTNQSDRSGIVTTDAIRFGGGMGNIKRGGAVSGLPRAVEGARYYAQWAGMPYSVYSGKEGQDDYADDINVRSHMTNYLAGGSPFVPDKEGLRVPIELALAVHSDAGIAKEENGLIGTLSIITSNYNDGKLNAGISRLASRDFSDALLTNVTTGLQYHYGRWNRRELYDRNYSETRLPAVPSAILETLSHQNFNDMRYGHDPHFKFTLARLIYKTILRYINEQHNQSCVVTPLAPDNFHIELSKNKARLHWEEVIDLQEPSAEATGYIVYTSQGGADFDNGTYVRGKSHEVELEPDMLYHFKVVAVNKGGRSFPTEVLSAYYHPGAKKTVMVVNNFHRLSSPAIRTLGGEKDFDMSNDPGITYGTTAGWTGYGFVAGNEFNYVATHAKAIASAQEYNIVSASDKMIEAGKVKLKNYALVDLVLGLERNDGHSLVYYKTFTKTMRKALEDYTRRGGALLVSGAYIGTDIAGEEEEQFVNNTLKCVYGGQHRSQSDTVEGMGTQIAYYNTLNEEHYAATSADILSPMPSAFAVMRYTDGQDAAVAYKGKDYRSFIMGFPFECIKSEQQQGSIMRGILNFLLK
ncbi:MAG: xanthan lyase [Prevotella sp.]|nr:xanthan lyase [Prevotella sp.]MBR1546997.1 xanthan lyase [Prevotella sp.]